MFSDRAKGLVVTLVFLGFAAVVVAVVRGSGGEPDDMRPVATIDGTAITKGRFNKSYVQRLMASGRNDTPGERFAQLDNLIQIRLLAEEARRRGFDRTPEFAAFEERSRLSAAGAAYYEDAFAADLPPLTDDEVREAYRKGTEQVVLRHLFFRTREQAELAVQLLKEGEDFVDLANEVFDTPEYDSTAGMLGVAKYWDLDDAVAEAAFSLAPFEISEPVRSRYGWHVLRVEDRLVNPILTESEFRTRREGVAGRALIRRNRLQGDRWVRQFMEALSPQVDADVARMVVDALDATLKTGDVVPRVEMTPEEVRGVERELTPESVLIRYTLDGQEMEFTAGDFVRWLPELPYEEVRDRPMAAVGRALRNQALGIKGIHEGFDRDEAAVEAVRYTTDRFLADTLRARLRVRGGVEPTEDQIAEAFRRLDAGVIREARADWWAIPFQTYPEADRALDAIENGRDPASYDAFERHVDEDIRRIELSGHLRRAPLRTPVVVCLEGGSCLVLRVDDRTIVRTTLDEKRGEIRTMLEKILPEERLTDSLFLAHDVVVDTTLFRRMMDFR